MTCTSKDVLSRGYLPKTLTPRSIQKSIASPRKARTARLRKDDADARLQRLGRGCDAGAQAAAADRHKDGVQLTHLPAQTLFAQCSICGS